MDCGKVLSTEMDAMRFPEFKLEDKYESSEQNEVWIYRKNAETLRLKIVDQISQEKAFELIENAQLTIQSLYDNAASAYPGMISHEIVCDQRFVPEKNVIDKGNLRIIYYVAYLSSRMQYGACTEDLTPYRGVLAWAYCQNKEHLEQMEVIVPKNDFDSHIADYVLTHICQ
jgi:predicted DNA-binding protein (UPF0251 family)